MAEEVYDGAIGIDLGKFSQSLLHHSPRTLTCHSVALRPVGKFYAAMGTH